MRFTQDHQWIDLEDGVVVTGLTAYAVRQLGDIIEVTQPAIGQTVRAGEIMAAVEGANAQAALAAPMEGEVVQVNEALADEPDLINAAPESLGWILRLKLADPNQIEALMDRPAYEAYLDSL